MKGLIQGGVPLALLCVIAGNSQATFDYATGPGTVQYALARPDGARVSLTMVVIGGIDTSQRQGISVHEWWDKTTSIAVLFDPTLPVVGEGVELPPQQRGLGLKTGQTIDIEGTMTTLPSRSRAVVCERIALYLDRFGYVAPGVPPLKGLLDPSVWPSRGWIPVQQAAFSSMSTLGMTLLGEFQSPLARDGIPGVTPMSVSSPSSSDGSWVYLTGQVVTYIGQYYSYDLANDGWMNVYYVQGVDRTPGIRVWSPAYYNPEYVGSIVDVMAKVDTKDGQRMLGIWSDDEWDAIDLSSSTHCIEPKILADGDYYDPLNVVPVGIINRDLGGATMGNNPGVTGSLGLYNIGSYVTTWGKVLETGTYQFDQYPITPYMVIDDGSEIYGNNQDITVFGANSFGYDDPAEVGDHVSVTGVSSIWKPSGSTPTYRSIWTSDYAVNQADPSTIISREVTSTGTISGTVKLYDMPTGLPNNQAAVNVYCTGMRMTTLLVTRQTNRSGSASYSFADVPKAVEVTTTEWPYTHTEYPQYIVSAKCDDYKTRTYTGLTPWSGTETPRNIYLPRLRKIYVMTEDTTLDPCSGGYYPSSTVVTTTVRDSDHNPIQGLTVRFRTNKGSFSSGSIVHNYTPTGTTNAQGQVTATLYGVPSEWGYPIVEATDDIAPLTGDDPDDDPYDYDWEQLHDQYGQPISITIYQPSANLELAANPTIISRCGNEMSTVTATVTVCGSGFGDVDVSFSTDKGVFNETETNTATATTNGSGVATVHLKASTDGEGPARVDAIATVYEIPLYASTAALVTIAHDELILTANRYSVTPSQNDSTMTAKLTTPSGVGISGKQVTFTTTAGSLSTYSGTTNSSGEVTTTLSGVTDGDFAVVEATTTNRCDETIKQRCQVDFLQSAADDWPMFMHDVRHQGYSRFYDATTTEDLTLVWSAAIKTADTTRDNWIDGYLLQHPTGGKATFIFPHPYIDSSPVHASGCPVIVGAWDGGDYTGTSTTGYVKAFNPTTGADSWRYPSNSTQFIGGVASTPCVAETGGVKRVYIGSMDGKVYCLNATTGAFVWSYQTTASGLENVNYEVEPARVLASPVVYNGRVYIGNESATVYCLNATTGAFVWSQTFQRDDSWPDRTGVSSVAIGPTAAGEMRAYVGCDNGHVYCLSLADSPSQRVIRDYAGEDGLGLGCIESSATAYAGNVCVGTSWYGGKDIVTLNAETGIPLWEKAHTEEFRATPAALDGHVLAGEDTGTRFYRLDATSGDPSPNQSPPNPLDAQYNRPNPAGTYNYFVGSAAYTSAGFGFVGNDNFALYTLSSTDNSLIRTRAIGGIVCSSPAISYAAQSGYRWVYFVSRVNGGTLLAYRQILN